MQMQARGGSRQAHRLREETRFEYRTSFEELENERCNAANNDGDEHFALGAGSAILHWSKSCHDSDDG